MDSSRARPLDGAFFGVNMLNTPTGMVYTFEEVCTALDEAGFANIHPALPDQTMSAVVAAEKPE